MNIANSSIDADNWWVGCHQAWGQEPLTTQELWCYRNMARTL